MKHTYVNVIVVMITPKQLPTVLTSAMPFEVPLARRSVVTYSYLVIPVVRRPKYNNVNNNTSTVGMKPRNETGYRNVACLQ